MVYYVYEVAEGAIIVYTGTTFSPMRCGEWFKNLHVQKTVPGHGVDITQRIGSLRGASLE